MMSPRIQESLSFHSSSDGFFNDYSVDFASASFVSGVTDGFVIMPSEYAQAPRTLAAIRAQFLNVA